MTDQMGPRMVLCCEGCCHLKREYNRAALSIQSCELAKGSNFGMEIKDGLHVIRTPPWCPVVNLHTNGVTQ